MQQSQLDTANHAARDEEVGEDFSDFEGALKAASTIRFAMVVTTVGGLSARPLTTQAADVTDGTLWFFVSASSELTRAVSTQPDLLLVYAQSRDGRYLSVNGRGTVSIDPLRIRELWSPLSGAFFKGGINDPELCLLRVDVSQIELWEPPNTRVGQFLKIAAAAMGAQVEPAQLGRHEVLKAPD